MILVAINYFWSPVQPEASRGAHLDVHGNLHKDTKGYYTGQTTSNDILKTLPILEVLQIVLSFYVMASSLIEIWIKMYQDISHTIPTPYAPHCATTDT